MSASVASHGTSSGPTMVKRRVDDRIKNLIEDSAARKHRSFFIIIGDKGKDQIVNLHTMVSRARHSAKVPVLWCMKSDPVFASTSKRRLEKQGRLEVKGGVSTEASKEAFSTFLTQTEIRYCHYKDTHKILGNTFGMAVLQDFEAITPNILARTIETVAGGGCIVLMLRQMRSLRQLYTMVMDVHSRYRTEGFQEVVPRFNERFILSMTDGSGMLCVDDDLNVLPFTSKMREYGKGKKKDAEHARLDGRLKHEAELQEIKTVLKNNGDVGPLVHLAQTVDQAKVILSLMQAVTAKSLNSTCVVTAARGRGKSTALGISVAGAVAQGFSNIFVTSPSPENLITFFEFVVKTLAELGYEERKDFEAMQSTNPDFQKCIIRINVFRDHRQTIQYIAPQDSDKFAQAELLVIDEAAALPLPMVNKMLGSYLVFLSSTVSGYEGTGRSLSMKLVADMRKHAGANSSGDSRALKELSMSDPIRYGPGDPIEAWLNKLLCLDATSAKLQTKQCPHPSQCELYHVNRDALFSYHPRAEKTLQNLVSLFVAAHYKNQPNDLQLMSDAPAHHIFVLCGPMTEGQELPDILCAIHACEEGRVSGDALSTNISKGSRPSGDLIPYTLAQNFLEQGFAQLAGLRIVRIATNPDFQRSGYGTRAMQLLLDYYRGNIISDLPPAEASAAEDATAKNGVEGGEAEDIEVRKKIPALFLPVAQRPHEHLDYVGVSFGVTVDLLNFWKKNGFEPVYLRQMPNELTAEHSSIVIHPLSFDLRVLRHDFMKRYLPLLSFSFRHMPTDLALTMALDIPAHAPHKMAALVKKNDDGVTTVDGVPQASYADIQLVLSEADVQRLTLYSTSYVDVSTILDLVPTLAKLYFTKRLFRRPDGSDGVLLSNAQAAVLLAVGLQCTAFEDMATASTFRGVQPQQLRAFFSKAINRIMEHINALRKAALGAEADATELKEVAVVDASGKVVGLSVTRAATEQKTSVDASLMRDAKGARKGAEAADAPARKLRKKKH